MLLFFTWCVHIYNVPLLHTLAVSLTSDTHLFQCPYHTITWLHSSVGILYVPLNKDKRPNMSLFRGPTELLLTSWWSPLPSGWSETCWLYVAPPLRPTLFPPDTSPSPSVVHSPLWTHYIIWTHNTKLTQSTHGTLIALCFEQSYILYNLRDYCWGDS